MVNTQYKIMILIIVGTVFMSYKIIHLMQLKKKVELLAQHDYAQCQVVQLNTKRSLININYIEEIIANKKCLSQLIALTMFFGSEDVIIHTRQQTQL